MFSITGPLLPGTSERSDICALVFPVPENSTSQAEEALPFEIEWKFSSWNKYGYIPIASTFTGLSEAFLGTVHSVTHLALSILDWNNREHHLREASIGGYHIWRGTLASVPIAGNIGTFVFDAIRFVRMVLIATKIKDEKGPSFEQSIYLLEGTDGRREIPVTAFKTAMSLAEKDFAELSMDEKIAIVRNYERQPYEAAAEA